MKERKSDKYKRIGFMIFQVAFAICALIFIFLRFTVIGGVIKKILEVLSPIFTGIVLCYLCSPLYNLIRSRLEKKSSSTKLSKITATVVCVLAVGFLIYGLTALIIPQLYDSLLSLYSQVPYLIERVSLEYNRLVSEKHDLAVFLGSESITEFLKNFVDSVIVPNVDKIATSLYTSLKSVAVWFCNFLIGLVSMCYLLNFKEKLLPQAKKIIYAVMRTKDAGLLCDELQEMNRVFGGFIKGKLFDSLIIGVLCFTVFSIFRIPYALLVSVIIGVTNVIPFFGPFIGAVPSALIIAIIDPQKGLWFILLVFIIQQLDGNVIGPKILGESTGLSSFWILFSILLFGGLFGFAGMVLAVPSWVVIMRGLRKLIEKSLRNKRLPSDTAAYEPGKRIEQENASLSADDGEQDI